MAWLCAHCGTETSATDSCNECGEAPYLRETYRLEEQIGHGASGITYRATRLADESTVAVKELSYNAMQSFEMEKLFGREAEVLQQLDHPGIPAFIDDFSVQSGKQLSLYLVQEFVDGKSLAEEMETRRYSESEILDVLEDLADILVYLQGLRPPVFHRDIKPSNVMRTDDDELVLIDFGSVKATTDGAVGGSTVAGTFGYMAPEQHWGKATRQTDLYGLGALGLTLLSRRDPTAFVGTNHRLDWKDEVTASEPMKRLLGDLLAHQIEDRPEDAADARELIRIARRQTERGMEQATAEFVEERRRTEDNEWAEAKEWDASANGPDEAEPARTETSDHVPSGEQGVGDRRAVRTADRETHRDGTQSSGSKRAMLALFGLLTVAAVVIGALIPLQMPAKKEVAGKHTTSAPSPGDERPESDCLPNCKPLDLPFKDGLEFGMSPEEVKKARPELEEATASTGHTIEVDGPARAIEAPGARFDAKMIIVEEPARCGFDFYVDGGLSHMRCRVTGLNEKSAFRRYVREVVDRLRKRYGKPNRDSGMTEKNATGTFSTIEGEWTWQDSGANLTVSAEYDGMMSQILNPDGSPPLGGGLESMSSQIVIDQALDAHDETIARIADEKAEKIRNRERMRERKREKELEKLREMSEDDSL